MDNRVKHYYVALGAPTQKLATLGEENRKKLGTPPFHTHNFPSMEKMENPRPFARTRRVPP